MVRIEQLKNLIVMAAVDGKLSEEEINFLAERCHEFGLSQEEFQSAFTEATSKDAQLSIPTEHAEKTELLRDLLRMMAADGQLSDTEKRLFALASVRMKIDRVEIDELIDQLLSSQQTIDDPPLL